MTPSVPRRIYTVRPLSASILCLPGLLFCFWYAWSAYKRFDRYRRNSEEDVALSAEIFQIHLFDVLRRDLKRISMDPPPDPSRIDTFAFRMSNDDLSKLYGGAKLESSRPYASALLEYDGRIQPVEVRLRGQRYWHLHADQPSLKVSLPKGKLLDDHRVFNLIDEPTPMMVGEELILDIARENKVLTPRSAFARVRMNGKDQGVYHYETQPDESLLRTNRRVPGSIYSGNLGSEGDTYALWNGAGEWKKPASRTDTKEDEEYRADIERLVHHVRKASYAEFADFAHHELDLVAFATMDYIDVAFGGNEHNFRQNHRYYFDPYRGRWEPIAWSFGGWRNHPFFNLVEHPISIRLKMTPGYLTLRDHLLYEFLSGDGAAAKVRDRGTKILKKLAPELRADPYWDAYHLLPRVDGFHRQMLRPLDLERAALVFESEMTTYRHRRDQLVRELERNPLYAHVGPTSPAADEPERKAAPRRADRSSTAFELVVDGRAGVKVTGISVELPESCKSRSWELRKASAVVASGQSAESRLEPPLDLLPVVRLVAREDGSDRDGTIRTELAAVAYPFALVAGCRPSAVRAEGIQLATGSRVRSRLASDELLKRVVRQHAKPHAVPKLEAGEVAPHPWSLEEPPAAARTIGPGDVTIDRTRVFGAGEEVTVAAGTRLRMSPGASLVFLGKVRFAGTKSEPIVVEPSGERWGGLAIHGRYTAGSSLEHTVIQGGTTPHWRLVPYPAMVNIHDTSRISIMGCRFGKNKGNGDVFHSAYVSDLVVTDTSISDASVDAWDLEFTEAVFHRVSVFDAGDDAIDLMGSKLELNDSVVAGSKDNGISAGEESHVTVRSTLVAGAKVGVLAKNASDVDLLGSLLYRNATGVRVYERTVRYAGESHVRANVLFAVEAKDQPVKRNDRTRDELDHGRVQQSFPQEGSLDHLLHDVLELRSWGEVEAWTAAAKAGVFP